MSYLPAACSAQGQGLWAPQPCTERDMRGRPHPHSPCWNHPPAAPQASEWVPWLQDLLLGRQSWGDQDGFGSQRGVGGSPGRDFQGLGERGRCGLSVGLSPGLHGPLTMGEEGPQDGVGPSEAWGQRMVPPLAEAQRVGGHSLCRFLRFETSLFKKEKKNTSPFPQGK